jgi:dimethylargininase
LLTRAIVRPPSTNFAAGLTTVELGKPDHSLALTQHKAYCDVLRSCELSLIVLVSDERYPDSTFVEDTAIVTERCAIVTRPGADSRRGEVEAIDLELSRWFGEVRSIVEPGTVDGGDICEVGNHFFIGISNRTNEAGARQLAEILAEFDYTSELIDVRNVESILHLKSGLAYVGENTLVVISELSGFEQFASYELIRVDQSEQYAANCVLINDSVLIANGHPVFAEQLQARGLRTIALEMSEYQKMDGGLSCLSLRF